MPTKFAKVTKGLYRGGKPSPEDLVSFKENGIKKIVSLDEESGQDIDNMCNALGFEHIIWGLTTGNDPKVTALKNKIIPTLLLGGPTYIHCFHGKDRTGMAVAMFRVYTGWSIKDALVEAYKFGMGKDLSQKTSDSYFNAVREFSKEIDTNNSEDIVGLMREQNSFAPTTPGINDSQNPSLQRSSLSAPADKDRVHFPMYEGHTYISSYAASRIFCKCKFKNLLKPTIKWWDNKKDAIKTPVDQNGELYSASIGSSINFQIFPNKVTNDLINSILVKDNIDIGKLRNGQYIVINPDALIDIKEEDDINESLDIGLNNNSTNSNFVEHGMGSGVCGGVPIEDVGEIAGGALAGAAGPCMGPFGGQYQF